MQKHHRIYCPACGRRMKLAADDFHERIICTACGSQFDAPLLADSMHGAHAPVPDHDHGEAELAALQDHIRANASTLQPAPARSLRVLAITLVALLLLGFVATGAVTLWRLHPPGVVASSSTDAASTNVAPATQPTTQRAMAATQAATQAAVAVVAPPTTRVPLSAAATTQRVAAPPVDHYMPNAILLSLRPIASSPTTEPATQTNITDERIGAAIKLAVDDLLIEFNKGELREIKKDDNTYQGLRALALYALLSSSQAIRDDRIKVTGPFMKEQLALVNNSLNASTGETMTYGRAIRATALAVYDRPEDRDTMKRDLLWLITANSNGAYTYGMPLSKSYRWGWDNSNSQFGLLGVWSGAEAGIEVPLSYWAAVERHWHETQLPNGTWGYAPRDPIGTLQMTAAGVASLFVTHDYLHVPKDNKMVVWPDLSPQLKNGLGWLEEDDHVVNVPGGNTGYTLYAIERAGLASGFKYFGKHDWYRELAARSLKLQRPDGSWADRSENLVPRTWGEVVETCFNLLFLSRGRHPVIMNKLRFEGASNNRPRDLSALSKFASRTLERPINWQVVSLKADWADWMDAPVLYISSDRAARFSQQDMEKLRNFALAGGMIFTNADGGSPAFNDFVRSLVKALFPQYELEDLPADHPIFTVWKSPQERPALQGVSNGSRLLLVHSPGDVAKSWQLRDFIGNPSAFEMGIDLFLYASGKGDLRNRLQSPWIAESNAPAQGPVPVARLRYAGDWDPEPFAWVRFSRWMKITSRIAIDARETPLASLDYFSTPLAVLTGRAKTDWTPQEIAAVRKFIQSGGHLLIDSCGGSVAFNDSATVLLHTACPDAKLLRLPRTDTLFTAGYGREDLTTPRVRGYVNEKMGSLAGGFYGLQLGHGSAIITDLDLTTGLLGTNTWGILGYRPDYATSLVKNWILYSAAQTIEEYGKTMEPQMNADERR